MELLFVFLSMLYLHVSDDFNQKIMADMKQKKWWSDQKNHNQRMLRKRWMYSYDYLAVMICHAFKWSFIIHVPLFVYYIFTDNMDLAVSILYLVTVIINTVIHAVIDDLKANRFKINLIQNQLFHFIQIVLTFLIHKLLILG